MQKELPRPPRNNRQDKELISKINLALDGLSVDGKIEILSKIIDFWEIHQNKDRYLAMGPIWEDQVKLQDDLIKKLERNNRLLKILAAVLLIRVILIYVE